MTSEVAVQQQELIMALQQAEAETAALRTALQVCICWGWGRHSDTGDSVEASVEMTGTL